MSKHDEYLERILERFDSYNLEDGIDRRFAVKPVWDYCQSVLLEIGVSFCGMDREVLKNNHLKTRWIKIRPIFSVIDDPSKWDQFINTLQNQRSKVEHDDYSIPDKDALITLRRDIESFKNWCLDTGRQYYRDSQGYDIVRLFNAQLSIYQGRASYIIDYSVIEPPFYMKDDYISRYEPHPFDVFRDATKYLRSRYGKINDIKDITKNDLEKLIIVIKNVERFDVKEYNLLEKELCPFCGSPIIETETEQGGGPEDPPSSIHYRIGCSSCKYELNSETIHL